MIQSDIQISINLLITKVDINLNIKYQAIFL